MEPPSGDVDDYEQAEGVEVPGVVAAHAPAAPQVAGHLLGDDTMICGVAQVIASRAVQRQIVAGLDGELPKAEHTLLMVGARSSAHETG